MNSYPSLQYGVGSMSAPIVLVEQYPIAELKSGQRRYSILETPEMDSHLSYPSHVDARYYS
jgi:hypothetical protein